MDIGLSGATICPADITIVIAVKDRPEDLKLAVKSVMDQTILPRELIIIDDFSDVPIHPQMFGENLPVKVRVLRNAPNLGPAASYNRAVKESASPVVAFLDSDDYLLPNYVASVSETWKKSSPRPICVAAGFEWCTNNLTIYRTQIVTKDVTREALLRNGNFVGGCSVLSVDRAAFCSAGGYPDERGAYDWGLLLRLSACGRIGTLKRSLVLYRSPSASQISNDTKNFRRQIHSLFSIWRALPSGDRTLAKPVVTALIAMNLAQANRRALSFKLIKSLFKNGAFPKNIVFRTLIILLTGCKTYDSVMFRLAEFRAQIVTRSRQNILLKERKA